MYIETPDNRPKCKWKITEKLADGGTNSRECGSEERIYSVKGKGLYSGRERDTPVCKEHLGDAWHKWNVEKADPVEAPKRTTGCFFCDSNLRQLNDHTWMCGACGWLVVG